MNRSSFQPPASSFFNWANVNCETGPVPLVVRSTVASCSQNQLAVLARRDIELDHLRAQSNRLVACGERVFRMRITGAAMGADAARRHLDLRRCNAPRECRRDDGEYDR